MRVYEKINLDVAKKLKFKKRGDNSKKLEKYWSIDTNYTNIFFIKLLFYVKYIKYIF